MNREQVKKELQFRTSRSSGAGGQHVNKVESKVELLFSPLNSLAFSTAEKSLLESRVMEKLNKEGFLQITSQEARSQLMNKEIAEKKLFVLLEQLVKVEKMRKPTAIPKSVVSARKKAKAIRGTIKTLRKKVSNPNDGADFF